MPTEMTAERLAEITPEEIEYLQSQAHKSLRREKTDMGNGMMWLHHDSFHRDAECDVLRLIAHIRHLEAENSRLTERVRELEELENERIKEWESSNLRRKE